MGCIIVESHAETSSYNIYIIFTSIAKQNREPPISNILSVPSLYKSTFKEILLKAAVHIMEVEILVGR